MTDLGEAQYTRFVFRNVMECRCTYCEFGKYHHLFDRSSSRAVEFLCMLEQIVLPLVLTVRNLQQAINIKVTNIAIILSLMLSYFTSKCRIVTSFSGFYMYMYIIMLRRNVALYLIKKAIN